MTDKQILKKEKRYEIEIYLLNNFHMYRYVSNYEDNNYNNIIKIAKQYEDYTLRIIDKKKECILFPNDIKNTVYDIPSEKILY